MILFHGTLSTYIRSFDKDGILLTKSKDKLDFGKGFYATNDKEAAIATAKTKASKYGEYNPPISGGIIILEYNADNNCKLCCFENADKNWKDFVFLQRTSPYKHEYDIVCGPIADGRTFVLAAEYQSGDITKDKFCADIQPNGNMKDSVQYSFHSEKALSCIRIIGYAIIDTERSDGNV